MHGSKTAQAGLGRPRSGKADKAILRAALRLFVEHGIDGVGIEQIAEKAGVTRATVYRRWSSKEALLAAAIADARGAAEVYGPASLAEQQTSPDELIDVLVATLAAPDYRKIVARLVGSVPDHPELMSTYWQTYLVPRRNAALDLLKDAKDRELVPRDTDSEILLDLIGGAVMHHLLVRQANGSRDALRDYLKKVLRTLGMPGTTDRSRERPMRQKEIAS